MAYSKAHVILIGFSIDTPDSLENVKHKVRFSHCGPRLDHASTNLIANDNSGEMKQSNDAQASP